MDTESTIVAVASPPGCSARGLIRLSGACAGEVLGPHCTGVDQSRRGVFSGRLIVCDWNMPALFMCMPAPGSYTTQDVVELQLPGNPILLERVADAFVESGRSRGLPVRHAAPGEYTYRAWFSGRLSLDRAESVAAMISARSDADLGAARRSFRGGVGGAISPAADRLAWSLARVEGGIDFADEEDVVTFSRDDLRMELGGIADSLREHLGSFRGGEASDGLPTVVLRGPANAGKSTLFNSLLAADRVVTHCRAGTTRDAIVEEAVFDGVRLLLVDTPGDERSAASPARDAEAEADLVLLCNSSVEEPVVARAGALVVRTKCDLRDVPRSEHDVCAFDPRDVAHLRSRIVQALERQSVPGGGATLAVSMRQRSLIEGALASIESAIGLELDDAKAPLHSGLTRPAEVAARLREALDSLGAVVGSIPPDDVLERVFASFCVGK